MVTTRTNKPIKHSSNPNSTRDEAPLERLISYITSSSLCLLCIFPRYTPSGSGFLVRRFCNWFCWHHFRFCLLCASSPVPACRLRRSNGIQRGNLCAFPIRQSQQVCRMHRIQTGGSDLKAGASKRRVIRDTVTFARDTFCEGIATGDIHTVIPYSVIEA